MMAFIRVIALALALAGSTVWSSHPSESARNQYEAREDSPQPQLLAEATDHPPEVHMSQQSGFIKNSTNSSKQVTASDLQVGCGDGFIKEHLHKISEIDKNKVQSPKKKAALRLRRKRSFAPWSSGHVVYPVPYQSIDVWKPPIYQLRRPYYIPIYGVHGRIPIYYPPQPLYINTGVPKDNPINKPFEGPPYLPPVGPTTSSPPTTMNIKDRFNGGDNEDDRPAWDVVDQGATQRPLTTTTAVIPTRRTRPPGVPKTPPLVHKPTDPEGLQTLENDRLPMPPQGFPTVRPPQQRPQTTQRPPQTLPPARPNNIAGPTDPGRCVWAIISCCSTNNQISYECFEQRGCPGAFWDNNPCDSEFARAAIAAALNYYNN